MPPISRGFRGRRRDDAPSDRVPPGQYVTDDFPVLSAGPTPRPSWRLVARSWSAPSGPARPRPARPPTASPTTTGGSPISALSATINACRPGKRQLNLMRP